MNRHFALLMVILGVLWGCNQGPVQARPFCVRSRDCPELTGWKRPEGGSGGSGGMGGYMNPSGGNGGQGNTAGAEDDGGSGGQIDEDSGGSGGSGGV